jgi:hypothetical protein
MLRALSRRLTFANATSLLALVLAAGGGGYAVAASSGSSVVHACVGPHGVLHVRTAHRCPHHQKGLAWNRSGPPGHDGLAGAPATKLWAVVDPGDGAVLHASSPAVTAAPSGVGAYIDFHTDISSCAILATYGTNGSGHNGTVSAAIQDAAHPTIARVDYHPGSEDIHPLPGALNVAVFC